VRQRQRVERRFAKPVNSDTFADNAMRRILIADLNIQPPSAAGNSGNADYTMKIELDGERQNTKARESCSDEVRDFYERMPYPPPLTSLDDHLEYYSNPERRRALFHLLWPTERPRANQEILIAGCGTSQAARYALREPNARITAIDISETSLHHTRKLQQKYDLGNLDLHLLSILDVEVLRKSFDQIVCTGVLHHLTDPDLGLQSLRNVLKREGAMQIMVYASYGRTGIYMLQAYCRLLGITPSNQELQDLSTTLNCLPREHPLTHLLHKGKDFKHPEALADALLHPNDHAFRVPQIYEWLQKCRMSFGRWIEQAPYLSQCGMVARSPHAERLASLPSPLQHAAVELFRGTMVSHSFTAYRNDRSCAGQPITFAGDRWREYVPIALPWTVCVRENVPPGSVAVLINPAHKFSDLICPINSFENRVVAAIDGKRTIAEILDFVRVDGNDHEQRMGPRFFDRLWQYDQIVIDASRPAEYSLEKRQLQ
jgi:2-polyprenyl-3-methyl-5-hydroxy-6-metoxy-1,4-benzoquinol methylase